MRCQTHMDRDCPSAERCEIQGCAHPYGAPAQALLPERRPIDLPYQPGRIMRAVMAMTDRGAEAVKRGPTPFAILPPPEPLPMPTPDTVPQMVAEALAPIPKAAELRIVEVPGPAWLIYVGDKLLGMTQRVEHLVAR